MSGGLEIRVKLPNNIVSLTVTRNSPLTIEMTDEKGRTHRVVQRALLEAICTGCSLIFYATTTAGLSCPACYQPVKWQWGTLQMCFVPEKESAFPASSSIAEVTKPNLCAECGKAMPGLCCCKTG